jgi:prepilin signal peptidase PulO-like enzyme (type II secretory pathway)
MVGMELSFTNIFTFVSYITPFLVAFLLITIGFFNNEPLKSLIYIAGVIIAIVLGTVFQYSFKQTGTFPRSATCSVFNWWPANFVVPSLSSVFLSFSLLYLFFPMQASNNFNWSLLIFILVLLGIDTSSRLYNHCTTFLGTGLGLLLGGILSFGYYAIIKETQPDLLYFINSKSSNNVACSKPSKQTFKCSVYKNGKLIKNL